MEEHDLLEFVPNRPPSADPGRRSACCGTVLGPLGAVTTMASARSAPPAARAGRLRPPGRSSRGGSGLQSGWMFPCAYLRVFSPSRRFHARARAWGGTSWRAAHPRSVDLPGAPTVPGQDRAALVGRGPRRRPRWTARSTCARGAPGCASWRPAVPAGRPPRDGRRVRARPRRTAPSAAGQAPAWAAAVPFLLQSPWRMPIRGSCWSRTGRRLTGDPGSVPATYRTGNHKTLSARSGAGRLRRSELSPLADNRRPRGGWRRSTRSPDRAGYDGVSSLFSWDELDNDRSAAEVRSR